MPAPAMSPTPTAPTPTGRHHRRSTVRERLVCTVELVGRVGSLVSLAALLVVGGAVGGLFDGAPATADTTMRVTFGGP